MADDEHDGERTITFHLTPIAVWEESSGRDMYVPEGFAREGFIHCTDGETNLVATANRYYRGDARPFVVLSIDLRRVVAPVTRDDPGGIYPHIHGPLNRDAVVAARSAPRDDDGTFLELTARVAR